MFYFFCWPYQKSCQNFSKICPILQNTFGRLLLDFFMRFTVFFPPSELIETRFFPFLNMFYHAFRTWWISLILQTFIKTYKKTPAPEYLFWWSYNLEAYNFIERRLTVLSQFLRNVFHRYLRMVPSEIKSTKACKLCTVYINYFSQRARWLMGRNKMGTDKKKLRFILSDYGFKGRESLRL